tara:strand:- start:552 stop:812 length:261 start_codon:yes stop_codon:yes gene_type:complete
MFVEADTNSSAFFIVIKVSGETYTFGCDGTLKSISNLMDLVFKFASNEELNFTVNAAETVIDIVEDITRISFKLLKEGHYGTRYSF